VRATGTCANYAAPRTYASSTTRCSPADPSCCGSSESPWPLLGRRAAWKYPEGIQVIAEYWPLSSAVQVVSILAAESIEKIMEIVFEWNDIFDIDVYPAVSAEEGLRIGPEVFARLPRMQQHA